MVGNKRQVIALVYPLPLSTLHSPLSSSLLALPRTLCNSCLALAQESCTESSIASLWPRHGLRCPHLHYLCTA